MKTTYVSFPGWIKTTRLQTVVIVVVATQIRLARTTPVALQRLYCVLSKFGGAVAGTTQSTETPTITHSDLTTSRTVRKILRDIRRREVPIK